MEETRIWKGLGVVETIHESVDEDESSTDLSVSPDQTAPTSSLNFRVQAWSLATGQAADVVINVHNSSFLLHKDPLIIKSGYFRQHLKEVSQLALPPSLKITVETFTLVAEFCYGGHLVVTPLNIAPLRVASELLEMTEDDENLSRKTEDYFRHVISLNREYATVVFRSTLSMLPEAEAMARVVSRCIVALSLMGDDNGVMKCLGEVKDFSPDDFELIAESLDQRLTDNHDILYKMIDHYLKEYNGKLPEEQKKRICNYIDCASLSPQLLMHAVQNPIMPLRFLVQAMFVEQVNTRRSIVSATNQTNINHTKHQQLNTHPDTLGAILQRDAALREVAQLKAAMNVTSSRIQTLEKELSTMREIVHDSTSSIVDSGRSTSCRFGLENKIERGQVGSISSGGFRFFSRKDRGGGIMSQSEVSCDSESTQSLEKGYGRRLVKGVKNAFKLPSFLSSKKKMGEEPGVFLNKYEMGKVEDKNEDSVVVIKKDLPFEKPSS
ncbi:hypothetical protein Leryth_002347 [Lithospermum erythrorhizon]|nr:hypothetical protein Leryth_002347 [Lithospermum erythrorhizon]